MTDLNDVVKAFRAIGRARAHYEDTLRKALQDGVPQTAISNKLGRTRETLRKDAMTEEEREAHRKADADRKRAAKETTR